MNQERKLREASKAANRTIFNRTLVLMAVFGGLLFLLLIFQLYRLQIVQHEELEEQAIDQQTSELSVSALRGTIYDSNGNVLAISSTAYDVIISPKAISERQAALDEARTEAQEKGEDTADYDWNVEDVICGNLASILGLDESDLRERCQNTDSQYERLARRVDGEVEDRIRELLDAYELTGCVYLQPNTRRYYPFGSLAAQIIGFTNENGGAYGLEAMFDEQLTGTPGRVVTATDRDGVDLTNFFQDYYDAQDGDDIYLTLDTTIQSYCESYLDQYCEQYGVQNGATIIVMQCDTGAILGMATSPSFDLNDAGTVTDETLLAWVEERTQELIDESEAAVEAAREEAQAAEDGAETDETGTDEAAAETADEDEDEEELHVLTYDEAYDQAYSEAVYSQWNNKAVNYTYEPGSTFKPLVVAAGLEQGVISENSTFDCGGFVMLGDWRIRCSNRNGHGVQTLAEALGHSCNPAMISIAQSLGLETFYDYLYSYGLMEPTGIDLPNETSSYFWPEEEFSLTNMATASFGQRFQITPIQLITAFNSVVNGGYLRTPYVVDSITDSDGNTVYEAESQVVRQVISEETSAQMRDMLEGVVTSYTGQNAYMAGYRIGGKTGTSQTLVEDEDVVSFVGFAPANDPEIIALVMFDAPEAVSGTSYTPDGQYISGGAMAAPVAGNLIADVLDYLGYEPSYSDDDVTGAMVSMPDLEGSTESEAADALQALGLDYRTVGVGDEVTGQIPASGTSVPQNNTVILYLGEDTPDEAVEMPNLAGLTPEQALTRLNNAGLFMRATGVSGAAADSSTVCTGQSVEAGTLVSPGYVVTVQFGNRTATDGDVQLG